MVRPPQPTPLEGLDTDAIAWARAQFPANAVEIVSQNNWAMTVCLHADATAAYLKILPPSQYDQIRRYAGLAERFPETAPRLLASAPERGWLLLADHGGELLDGEPSDLVAVAATLASVQQRAAADSPFLATLQAVDLAGALPQLLDFLDRPAEQTGAAHFLGPDAARRYMRLLGIHTDLIAKLVARADRLPMTLLHGDLHHGNAARHPDGHLVLFDWDEMAAGPAGLCLHGLLSGCAMGVALLHRMATGALAPPNEVGAVLTAYVETLAVSGYATRAELLDALPGALCAGQMRFIASFGRYPGDNELPAAADTLTARLEDLLDLCDWLASKQDQRVELTVKTYEAQQEWSRALRLTQDLLAHAPTDTALLRRYARLCERLGQRASAEEAWQELLRFVAQDQEALTHAAQLHLDRLDLGGCEQHLAQARAHGITSSALEELWTRLGLFKHCLAQGRSATGWPRVPVTERERDSGQLDASTQALVLHLFRQQGAVQLDGVFSLPAMQQLQEAFAQQHPAAQNGEKPQGVLQVGHRRYMLTMTLDSTFGSPALVASGLYLPVMKALLGGECILSAYTAVVSLPGSTDQDAHKDHTPLFEEQGWRRGLPTFAAQVVVPLLEMNALTGATAVYKGSQGHTDEAAAEALPFQEPQVPLGSCLLIDYAIAHFGRGNRSSQVRPILNLVYSRPWFRDCRNYDLQPPLRFGPARLSGLDEAVRPLVSWWDRECRAALQGFATAD
jgi:tetratricopeptide (TPR) repeat protein